MAALILLLYCISLSGQNIVSGTIPLESNATDAESGMDYVQFQVDGPNVGPRLTQPPYHYDWDTRTVPDGLHTIFSMAWDKARNRAQAQTQVQVQNNSGLRFVPVTPCRVIDTRLTNDPMTANSTKTINVIGSACNIPLTARAYAMNVTVVPTAGTLSSLVVFAAGTPRPSTLTLVSADGRTKSDATIVSNTGGSVDVYAGNATHLILDITGYFSEPVNAPNGFLFYPVAPCRVMDTRLANGQPIGARSIRTVSVLSGSCQIPPTAAAYSLNITVVPGGFLDYLTTWPTGQPQPFVSNLNDYTGTVVANAAIIPAGTGGQISIYASQQTHVVVDINGYFAPFGSEGLLFHAFAPCRAVDTRKPEMVNNEPHQPNGLGAPMLSGLRVLPLVGNYTVAGNPPGIIVSPYIVSTGPCPIDVTAKAISLNATVIPPAFLDYLTLWPTGATQPFVSTLNAYDASIVSNGAIVPISDATQFSPFKSISAFSSQPTELILDFNGYFGP